MPESFTRDEKQPIFIIKVFTEHSQLEIDSWQQLVAKLAENRAIIENLIPPIATILPDFGIPCQEYNVWTNQVLSSLKELKVVAGFYGLVPSKTGYLGKKSPFYFGRFLQIPIPLLENLLTLKKGEWHCFQKKEWKSKCDKG